jgi:hypothetical protein
MVLQFQDQLDDIRATEGAVATLRAVDRFDLLPPVGLLPLEISASTGFDQATFFASLTVCKPVFVEGAVVESVVGEACAEPPIALASGEAIRLYLERENEQPPSRGRTPARPYVLFVSGRCTYRADAQFDLSYWDYSNFAQSYC